MGGINAQDFINELIFCLNAKDTVKAKALLQFASDANVDVHVQKMALAELAKGSEDIVFPLLEYLTKIEISNTEVQECLHDLILDKAYGNTNLVTEYITNNEKKTRIQFIRVAGDLFLEETIPALIQVVKDETDPEIITPAINSLAVFQKPEHIEIFSSFSTHSDPDITKAAIFAIGAVSNPRAADTLISFLCEDDTINKLVVQALAEKGEKSFRELAGTHIAEKASPSTRKAFLKNMAAIGQVEFAKEVAAKITGTDQAEESSSMKIVVVDDSKMMLKLYQNKLSLLGLACEIYCRPEDAVKRILSGKTALVITDLNMPNISGLELTMEIRRKFTQTDLPVLMITTQSDFIEEKEEDIDVNEALLKKFGINIILHKPFSDNDFKESVFKLLPT